MEHLLIYGLLDCSASMAGEPLEAMKQGVKAMLAELKNDAQTRNDARLSLIIFDSIAREASAPSALKDVTLPYLYAGGVSALLPALKLLEECLKRDEKKWGAQFKPIVFLFTDGSWLEKVEDLRSYCQNQPYELILCAAGAKVEQQNIAALAKPVIMLNNLSIGSFSQYCIWNERN